MYLYLFLAGFWGLLGGGWLIWHQLHPESWDLLIRSTNISAGWLGIVVAYYNVARFWSLYSQRRYRARNEPPQRDRNPKAQARPDTPDPNFDFR